MNISDSAPQLHQNKQHNLRRAIFWAKVCAALAMGSDLLATYLFPESSWLMVLLGLAIVTTLILSELQHRLKLLLGIDPDADEADPQGK